MVVQDADTQSMSAFRSFPSSAASWEAEACGTSATLGTKENLQPALCIFTFSSRRCPGLDTRKFISFSHVQSLSEAVPSPVNRQRLSPTTATEAYSHVAMRYTDDAQPCQAQLSVSAPTAYAANRMHTENSMQALTAAKAASCAASNSLLPPAGIGADGTMGSSCTSSAANAKHGIATNTAAILEDCGACHAPIAKNTQVKGSIAATT